MTFEQDDDTYPDAVSIPSSKIAVAWYVLGWETESDEDTEWSGYRTRTGQLVCVMVGDDRHHLFDPEDIKSLPREDYCGECGQIGCSHNY